MMPLQLLSVGVEESSRPAGVQVICDRHAIRHQNFAHRTGAEACTLRAGRGGSGARHPTTPKDGKETDGPGNT